MSRARLVACAAELFWRQGYHATGLSDILNAAELPKGPFYFYFKSKLELGTAVIEYYREAVIEAMEQLAEGRRWPEFIHALIQRPVSGAAEGGHPGCPFAVMCMELALSEPDIAGLYGEAMDELRQTMADVLERSGLNAAEAQALSAVELAIFEGKLLLFRVSGSPSHLQEMGKAMLQAYASALDGKEKRGEPSC